jgi:thioredoxin-dependent peroxiredoxin
MPIPRAGAKAPTFTLKNQDDKAVGLKEFSGTRVVLYFYPAAMTPGCTVQACGMRDHARELKRAGAIALGVSPDVPAKLKRFVERDNLNFDLLSDPDHATAEKYGVWGPKKFMGRSFDGILRTTFLIDEKGVVRHVIESVKTKTHHDDVLKRLAEMS